MFCFEEGGKKQNQACTYFKTAVEQLLSFSSSSNDENMSSNRVILTLDLQNGCRNGKCVLLDLFSSFASLLGNLLISFKIVLQG